MDGHWSFEAMEEQLKLGLTHLGFIEEGDGIFSHLCQNNQLTLKAIFQNGGVSFQLTTPESTISRSSIIVRTPDDIAKALIELIDSIPQ